MKKICFVTGSRADYGLLSHLMKSVEKDKNLKLQVIVTGSHLSKKFGNTKKEIENDKIKIDKKIDILSKNDSPIDILKNTSIAIKKISLAINQLKPELVILLGDRYEIFSAAISAYFMRIPIAHFHGGEVTEGAIDDSIRHSITKMASLHLVSNLLHKKRLIQLGENKMNIHNVGALGIDVIKNTKLISKELLGRKLKIKFQKKIIVITFHPVTLENNTSEEQINEILKSFKDIKNTTYIFTLPNADMHGNIIIKSIEIFCKRHKNAFYYKSLGKTNFYSLINISNLFIGNSSSGIIEVPYFKKPIINIGDRQKGRLQSKTIINCKPESNAIIKAIKLSQSAEYISLLRKSSNPYEKKSTTLMSLKFIKEKINKLSVMKKFYDIKF